MSNTKEIVIDGEPGLWTSYEVEIEPPPPPPQFNAGAFFDYIRKHLFGGSLSQSQVDGFNYLGPWLAEAFQESDPVRIEKSAYCLATFQWETAHQMQPNEEWGKGRGKKYGKWYGRGYVHLTWEDNYRKQQKKLARLPIVVKEGIPYKVHDDRRLALNPDTAAIIGIEGMKDGDFTGKKLSDYIRPGNIDYVNARRIVNGNDRKHEIAAMAEHYENAIAEGYREV